MSWQARALNRLLRRFVKRRHQRLGVSRERILATRRRGLWCSDWIIRPVSGTRIERVRTNDVTGEWVRAPSAREDRVVYFIHGGAFVIGRPANYRHLASRLSKAAGARVFSVDYRRAPEHAFPAALKDVRTGWHWLEESSGVGKALALAGDSAGGGLALSLMQELKQRAQRLPLAFAGMAPWVDLSLSADSIRLNAERDPYIAAELLPTVAELYLQGADPLDPRASPLFGQFDGLPPMLIHACEDEVLRDDATRLVQRARAAGVDAELELWGALPHGFQLFSQLLPEGRDSLNQLGGFLARHWQGEESTRASAVPNCRNSAY